MGIAAQDSPPTFCFACVMDFVTTQWQKMVNREVKNEVLKAKPKYKNKLEAEFANMNSR